VGAQVGESHLPRHPCPGPASVPSPRRPPDPIDSLLGSFPSAILARMPPPAFSSPSRSPVNPRQATGRTAHPASYRCRRIRRATVAGASDPLMIVPRGLLPCAMALSRPARGTWTSRPSPQGIMVTAPCFQWRASWLPRIAFPPLLPTEINDCPACQSTEAPASRVLRGSMELLWLTLLGHEGLRMG
jgi:hypothetical protein